MVSNIHSQDCVHLVANSIGNCLVLTEEPLGHYNCDVYGILD